MNRTIKRLIIAGAVLDVSTLAALVVGATIVGAAEEEAMRTELYI